MARYRQLRAEHADEYRFRDIDLLVIGDKLLGTGRHAAAVAFLELSLEQYPDSDYAYYAQFELAQALEKLGRLDDALRHCRTARELRPDSEAIAALLEELEGRQTAP